MFLKSDPEGLFSLFPHHHRGFAGVNVLWGHQADPGMVVFGVIPTKELSAYGLSLDT